MAFPAATLSGDVEASKASRWQRHVVKGLPSTRLLLREVLLELRGVKRNGGEDLGALATNAHRRNVDVGSGRCPGESRNTWVAQMLGLPPHQSAKD